ncbi:hypothetical protein PMI30_02453 [Pseudomonas sp. GM50]|nr:hypothetical protein PMI30_02453 [Pseudomonas sp. GM50]
MSRIGAIFGSLYEPNSISNRLSQPHRPVRLRSSRKLLNAVCLKKRGVWFRGASHPNGGKPPHHSGRIDAQKPVAETPRSFAHNPYVC